MDLKKAESTASIPVPVPSTNTTVHISPKDVRGQPMEWNQVVSELTPMDTITAKTEAIQIKMDGRPYIPVNKLVDARQNVLASQRMGCNVPRNRPVDFRCNHTGTWVKKQPCVPGPSAVLLNSAGQYVVVVRNPKLDLACVLADATASSLGSGGLPDSPIFVMLSRVYQCALTPRDLPLAPPRHKHSRFLPGADFDADAWHAKHIDLPARLGFKYPAATNVQFIDEPTALLLRSLRETVSQQSFIAMTIRLSRFYWAYTRSHALTQSVRALQSQSTTITTAEIQFPFVAPSSPCSNSSSSALSSSLPLSAASPSQNPIDLFPELKSDDVL